MSNEYVVNSLMNGYMVKRGSFVKNWKRRFFVLSPRFELLYFQQKGDETAIKCLFLAPDFDLQSLPKRENGFLIRMKNARGKKLRDFQCYTETKEDYVEWWRCFTEVKAKLHKKRIAATSGGPASESEKKVYNETVALRKMMREIFGGGSDVVIAHSNVLQVPPFFLKGIEKANVDQTLIQLAIQHRESKADSDWYEHAHKIQINTGSSISTSLAAIMMRRFELRNQFNTSGNVKRSERILFDFKRKHIPKKFHDVKPERVPHDDILFLLFDFHFMSSVTAAQENDLDEVENNLHQCTVLMTKGEEYLTELKAKRKINNRILEDLTHLNVLDKLRLLYIHGWLFAQQKEGEKSIESYKEALKLSKEFKLDIITRSLLTIIAEEYYQLNDYISSKNYYTKVNRLDTSTCFALVPDGS
eukprot:CAMPEP_0117436464 /NCGR_PEP_ID=MMETSP0759-20121206/1020_1 /TAXON_ID=63605 /ORGANISM="Percolomonas cosmopolitus, Strain WS" /LENGTH=415 /DNA_ID=CAMNT_0005228063 /DNA_START=174 /DNA_END=1417 /DNA_ORIENTATION=+